MRPAELRKELYAILKPYEDSYRQLALSCTSIRNLNAKELERIYQFVRTDVLPQSSLSPPRCPWKRGYWGRLLPYKTAVMEYLKSVGLELEEHPRLSPSLLETLVNYAESKMNGSL